MRLVTSPNHIIIYMHILLMSAPLTNFTSIEYLASNVLEYLKEIQYNTSLLLSMQMAIDSNGNSINWQVDITDVTKVCDGICEIIDKMILKNFGEYSQIEPYLFLLIIFYYSDYYTRSSVTFTELDTKYINKNSPDYIFGTGLTDSQIYSKIMQFMDNVTNAIAAFESINQDD